MTISQIPQLINDYYVECLCATNKIQHVFMYSVRSIKYSNNTHEPAKTLVLQGFQPNDHFLSFLHFCNSSYILFSLSRVIITSSIRATFGQSPRCIFPLVDSLSKEDHPTLLVSHFSNFYHPFPKKPLESIPLQGLFVCNYINL